MNKIINIALRIYTIKQKTKLLPSTVISGVNRRINKNYLIG